MKYKVGDEVTVIVWAPSYGKSSQPLPEPPQKCRIRQVSEDKPRVQLEKVMFPSINGSKVWFWVAFDKESVWEDRGGCGYIVEYKNTYANGPDGETLGPSGLKWL